MQWRCASQHGVSVQPRPHPMPMHVDFEPCSHSAIRNPSLCIMVSTHVIHAWITTHLQTPEGWKAELTDP